MSGVVWVSAHPRIKYGAGSERVEGHEGNGTALPLTWFDKLTMSGATNHHHSCVWAMRCRGGSRTAPTHMVRPAHHEREEVGMSGRAEGLRTRVKVAPSFSDRVCPRVLQ